MTAPVDNLFPAFSDQSKFQFLPEPLQQIPHKCASCFRYSSNDPQKPLEFVTWLLDVEFYGMVFICKDCLREIANQMGWASDLQVEMVKKQNASLQKSLSEFQEENVRLRRALDNLELISPISVDPGTSDVVPDPVTVSVNEGPGGGEGGDAASTTDYILPVTAGEDGVNESSDVEGPSGVYDADHLKSILDDI